MSADTQGDRMTRYRAQTNAPDPGHCVVETVPNDPGERIVAETLTRADAEMVAAALNGRGAVDDRNWLAGLVYEFLLIGPRQRTQLNEAEMKRFLAIPRGGQ